MSDSRPIETREQSGITELGLRELTNRISSFDFSPEKYGALGGDAFVDLTKTILQIGYDRFHSGKVTSYREIIPTSKYLVTVDFASKVHPIEKNKIDQETPEYYIAVWEKDSAEKGLLPIWEHAGYNPKKMIDTGRWPNGNPNKVFRKMVGASSPLVIQPPKDPAKLG